MTGPPSPKVMLRHPRAVVFDFDLTLVESTAGVAHCVNYALSALGLPLVSTEQVRHSIGLTLPESFHLLAGTRDAELTRAYLEHYRVRADAVMADMVHFLPGAADALLTLRARGCRTAIVSSRYRYRIAALLNKAGLDDAVDLVVGGDDVRRHKPDPEGIALALDRLGVPPAVAMYVGDHAVDAEAAGFAGVPFVAVLTGVNDRAAWTRYAPTAVIDSVADLQGVLAGPESAGIL